MSSIMNLPTEIKKEFRIDSDGKVTTSIRGAARLAGVYKESILKSSSASN